MDKPLSNRTESGVLAYFSTARCSFFEHFLFGICEHVIYSPYTAGFVRWRHRAQSQFFRQRFSRWSRSSGTVSIKSRRCCSAARTQPSQMNAPGANSMYGPSLRHAAQTGRAPFLSINHIGCFRSHCRTGGAWRFAPPTFCRPAAPQVLPRSRHACLRLGRASLVLSFLISPEEHFRDASAPTLCDQDPMVRSDKVGWNTDEVSRQQLISGLDEAIRQSSIFVHDPRWVTHYHQGRPHMSLGPGIPTPQQPPPPESTNRHRITAGHVVRSKPVLGGLHHEYSLEKVAA